MARFFCCCDFRIHKLRNEQPWWTTVLSECFTCCHCTQKNVQQNQWEHDINILFYSKKKVTNRKNNKILHVNTLVLPCPMFDQSWYISKLIQAINTDIKCFIASGSPLHHFFQRPLQLWKNLSRFFSDSKGKIDDLQPHLQIYGDVLKLILTSYLVLFVKILK